MSELCIPLDYEQLSELWQLRAALTAKRSKDISQKQIEQAASYIFHRLFVVLGYLARSTNEPGFLSNAGGAQFRLSLEPLYGEDCDPLKILEAPEVGLLRAVEGGWFCDMFARLNPHLAGNYKAPHQTGNVNSRISAALKKVTGDVEQQCMLFPAEFWKDSEGKQMSDTDAKRSMILIQMLDRCLDKPQRHKSNFTPGLMTVACAIVRKHDGEKLREFYFWVANNREHPAVPKSSELMMEQFDKYFELSHRG